MAFGLLAIYMAVCSNQYCAMRLVHSAFYRNGAEHVVKGELAVGSDKDAFVLEYTHIADFALFVLGFPLG